MSLVEVKAKPAPIYDEPDNSHVEAITQGIRRDLETGMIDRLTFSIGRARGLTVDTTIREIQRKLKAEGLLYKKGNRYLSTYGEAA